MKKFKIFNRFLLIGLLVAVTSQSCTNLDEDLYSEVTPDNFFQTEEQFVSAMAAAYTSLRGYASGDYFALSEISTDEMVVPTRGQDWDDGGHWRRLHLHSWNFEDPVPGGVWGFAFGGISNCNRMIYTFEVLIEEGKVDPDFAEPFFAELRVLRAFFYYVLIDVYGNVPIVTKFAGADPAPPNKSRAEVFQFIINDLNENIPKLSKAVDQSTYARVNYYVGQMILAKMYLNAEAWIGQPMWDDAITALDKIINDGKYTLEPNYFTNFDESSEVSKEFIFALPYDEVFYGGFNLNMRTLHYGSQDTYNLTSQPWNGFCSLEEFYNSYDDDDLRKGKPGLPDAPYTGRGNFLVGYQFKSNGEPVIDTGAEDNDPDGPHLNFTPEINELGPQALRQAGARIGKWEFALGSTPNMSNDYGVFRYADVLLMKAEALWRLSGNATDAEALALVNLVRSTHGGPAIGLITSLDGPVSFAPELGVIPGGELLNERGREMAFESSRRQDLIRWGLFDNVDKWAPPVNNPGDVIGTGDYLELYPIPRGQLDANKNLVQNPGYSGGGGG